MSDAIKYISCPKCGTQNERERVYCWVCYQDFTSNVIRQPHQKPALHMSGAPRPAMVAPGVSFSGDRPNKKPPSSLGKFVWYFIVSVLMIGVGMILLTLVTCGGMLLSVRR